jgi:hypothetical protein
MLYVYAEPMFARSNTTHVKYADTYEKNQCLWVLYSIQPPLFNDNAIRLVLYLITYLVL